jgi:hypothetical protein
MIPLHYLYSNANHVYYPYHIGSFRSVQLILTIGHLTLVLFEH